MVYLFYNLCVLKFLMVPNRFEIYYLSFNLNLASFGIVSVLKWHAIYYFL